jgi:hypothetical protein
MAYIRSLDKFDRKLSYPAAHGKVVPAQRLEGIEATDAEQAPSPGVRRWWALPCARLRARLGGYLRPRMFAFYFVASLLWAVYSLNALLVCLLAIASYSRLR